MDVNVKVKVKTLCGILDKHSRKQRNKGRYNTDDGKVLVVIVNNYMNERKGEQICEI